LVRSFAMLSELAVAPRIVAADQGTAQIWLARPGLVFTRVEGRMVMEHAQAIMETVDAAVRARPGQVCAVHDFTGIESYEIAVHARMSTWSVSVVRSMRRIVVGVSSPLVALAVRTANLATGGRFELLDTREQVLSAARAELSVC
jgi:hypothetical protein